jgi:antitoxin component HigA of HigAB toxin-antitoxin module
MFQDPRAADQDEAPDGWTEDTPVLTARRRRLLMRLPRIHCSHYGSALVERYEEQVDAIEPPDPIEALRYHMESRGLTRRDLEPFIGSRARVAEVLNRRRALSIDMIRRLHEGLGISADVLIRPYDLRGRRSAA